MKHSLREVLENSHIAAVAILVLLFWSLESAYRALWDPLIRAASSLITFVAIYETPTLSSILSFFGRVRPTITLLYLSYAAIDLVAAWILSYWVFGASPLRILTKYNDGLAGRNHV